MTPTDFVRACARIADGIVAEVQLNEVCQMRGARQRLGARVADLAKVEVERGELR